MVMFAGFNPTLAGQIQNANQQGAPLPQGQAGPPAPGTGSSGGFVLPTQPPDGWEAIYEDQARAQGMSKQADYLRSALDPKNAKDGLSALAVIIGQFAAQHKENKANSMLGKAIGKSKGMDRYEKKLDRLDEIERTTKFEQRAIEREKAAEKRAEARDAQNFARTEGAWNTRNDREEEIWGDRYKKTREDAVSDRDVAIKAASDLYSAKRADKQNPPLGATAKADYGSKVTDTDEALGILDNMEGQLTKAPWYKDTGPLDQYIPGKFGQEFDAAVDQLYQVAKRVYKTPGEGMFSDADARALKGMLPGSNRYSGVNKKLISDMRGMLTGRRDAFSQYAGQGQGQAAGADISSIIQGLSPEAQAIIQQAMQAGQ